MSTITNHEIPGGWTEEEIRIEDRVFRVIKPAKPDEFLILLDPISGEPLDGIEPYWATVWQAAPAMSRWILRRKWQSGDQALEIGAGVGIVGLAALAQGLDVTFSDYSEIAVSLAVENAHRNGFQNAQGLVLDWNCPLPRKFPIILGCDILYDWKNHDSILQVIDQMLAPNGECWIGDPGRFHSASFPPKAIAKGYLVDFVDEFNHDCAAGSSGEFRVIRLIK